MHSFDTSVSQRSNAISVDLSPRDAAPRRPVVARKLRAPWESMAIIMETMKRDGEEEKEGQGEGAGSARQTASDFYVARNNTDRENICYTISLTNQPDVRPILRDACLRNRI